MRKPDLGAWVADMSEPITHATLFRLGFSLAAGTITALVAAGSARDFPLAVMTGWVVGAATFCAWTWAQIGPMDGDDTRAHATREDPGRALGDTILLVASIAGLGGVGVLIVASGAKQGGGQFEAAVGMLAVAASWVLVHTLFTVRYARIYFTEGGGIDFNSPAVPTYADFAYLGFTIGMTYQVSDTTISTRSMRATLLRHALVSFLLGAVILASTVNLVSQVASAGA